MTSGGLQEGKFFIHGLDELCQGKLVIDLNV